MKFCVAVEYTLCVCVCVCVCARARVRTSPYVCCYKRGDVWNVGVVNVQLFAVGICAAEN